MGVIREAESLVTAEAAESHVALDLVILGHAESSMRADRAIVLNGHHQVEQTVLLDQAAIDHTLVRILGRCVLKRITLFNFLFFRSIRCKLLWRLLSVLFDVNVSAVADEWREDLVVLRLVLPVHVAELAEHEVVRAREEEALRGELVLVLVCNSHGDVVVAASAAHTAPEKELLEIGIGRVVQQLLQAHVQAKSIPETEHINSLLAHPGTLSTYLSSTLKHWPLCSSTRKFSSNSRMSIFSNY